ncbi:hypothetical protein [Nocardioides sp. 503]|uniref:hypothetical protein n=1 Tax=Nocardioides sp. 503 TaxID=2508326 RepID=UPI001FD688E9|nr:hypothetical protein [Nocardioides sp. 503]
MTALVVEENMGTQHADDGVLVDSTKEKRVIDHDTPGLESLHRSLVRRGIARRDQRNVQPDPVARLGELTLAFARLDLRHLDEKRLQGTWVVCRDRIGTLVAVKLRQPALLHHLLGGVVRENAVEVERNPKIIVLVINRCGR